MNERLKKSVAVVGLVLFVSEPAAEAAHHRSTAEEARAMLAKLERRKSDDAHEEVSTPRPEYVRTLVINASTTQGEIYGPFIAMDMYRK